MKHHVNTFLKQISITRLLGVIVLLTVITVVVTLPNTATTYAQSGGTSTLIINLDTSTATSTPMITETHLPPVTATAISSSTVTTTGLEVIRLAYSDNFLTLPFLDENVRIQQGWVSHFDTPPCNIYPEIGGQCVHQAIDYILGTPHTDHTRWKTFEVVAAAPGQATCKTGHRYAGNYVEITHSINGRTYITRYSHLQSCLPNLLNRSVDVERGEKIGDASDSGSAQGTGIHLHFALKAGGSWIDPYDIKGLWDDYPNSTDDLPLAGSNHNWSTNPPRVPSSDTTPPTTRVTSGPSGWIRTDSATIEWTGSDDQTSKANLVYSYKLDGASWSSWTGNTSKTYNNLAEGSHTFWVKAKDEAGNIDASPAERSFKVDTTKPNTPTINPGCTASDNQWQNTCRDPSFSWSATDPNGSDGSGVDEYAYAWNTSANGNPSNWGSVTSHNPGPIVDSDGVGQYYLHVKAKDVAGNTSSVNSFGLWYDGSAPTTALAINGGASTTNQVTVHLNIEPSDTGGGVSQVRISNNGIHWTPWQPYAETISWAIPALDLHTHTVYVQVRDHAGNTSTVVSDDIYLDLYPVMPHSANYRICVDAVNAGGSAGQDSNSFKLVSSIGQPLGIGGTPSASANFTGEAGFLADMEHCLPIEHIFTDNYRMINSVIASGGNLRSSATYKLGDTTGQPTASGANVLSSASYQLSSGFWGDAGTSDTPDQCTFSGTIDLQSRTDDSGVTFTAGVYSTTTDTSGYYELTVPEDTYDVSAEMDRYLDGERTGEVCPAGETVQLPDVTLLGGDANDDCAINILDLSFMGARFGTSTGDASFDPKADINADGAVNILDLAATGGNFWEECPVDWP